MERTEVLFSFYEMKGLLPGPEEPPLISILSQTIQ